jgi:ABC-type sugar transport system permease subunit
METKENEKAQATTSSTAPAVSAGLENDVAGIDFKGVRALSNTDFVPEPWYKRLGWGLLEALVSLGLFLLGIILDVIKALVQVVVGLFTGIVKIIFAIGRFFRRWHRIFHEVDGYGRGSFLIQGLEQFKCGQIADGIIFLSVEVLFILFMVFWGGVDVFNLIPKTVTVAEQDGTITTLTCLAEHFGQFSYQARPASVYVLIRGLVGILIIVAYFIVYCKGITAAYDDYQIVHNFEFRQAHEDQLHVLRNRDHYTEIDFYHDSALSIRHKMRNDYGYSVLSARYISYVPFKRIKPRNALWIGRTWQRFVDWFYRGYSKVRDQIRAGKWSSIFAKYLDWKPAQHPSHYGLEVVRGELEASLNRFHHTYDKYNDYLGVTRDLSAEIAVLAQTDLVLASVFAEDAVSKANDLKPIPHDQKIKSKDIVSRIVGTFGVNLEIARDVARILANGLKKGGEAEAKAEVVAAHAHYLDQLNAFKDRNSTKRLAGVHGVEKAYGDYQILRAYFDQGKKSFIQELVNGYHVGSKDAEMIYKDYRLAIKSTHDDEAAAQKQLLYRQGHYHKIVALYETYPFHGQPIHFKKEIKMYTDERFAVTVLSLPVIGAMATCVIPLVFSIIIAFTNYDRFHTTGTFTFSWDGFSQFFGANAMTGYSGAFVKLLGWTIVWAFFATFTNYIFGIILALLINKKGIHLKKLWRTLFVITIAIPQFITLLTMNLLLGDNGAVNGWLLTQSWYTSGSGVSHWFGFGHYTDGAWVATAFPFLSSSANNSIWPKMTLIVVNMWIGIPYTMLSTSGILMNIPDDLYESARIDGAGAWTQFWKITMPYVLFVTGPSLLTTFIGNINNFNVIFFLTGGLPSVSGVLSNANAGSTDLLITWLYNLTVNKYDYATASVIGIGVFVVCAFFSLIVYKRLGSTQNEEEFQ